MRKFCAARATCQRNPAIGAPVCFTSSASNSSACASQDVVNAHQDRIAVGRFHPRPGPLVERAPRGRDRRIDLAGIGFAQQCVALLARRIDQRQVRAARLRGDTHTVDQTGNAVGNVHGRTSPRGGHSMRSVWRCCLAPHDPLPAAGSPDGRAAPMLRALLTARRTSSGQNWPPQRRPATSTQRPAPLRPPAGNAP